MVEDGYFKEEVKKQLGLTDEQNQEMREIADEAIKLDREEQAKRVGKKVVEEFKRRHPDWIQQGLTDFS